MWFKSFQWVSDTFCYTSGTTCWESKQQKRNLKFHLYTLWLFTYSDLKTIVSTQTAVGIFSALAGSSLTTNQTPHFIPILSRTPHVLLWNWLNLLCFNIANQRLPKSIIEDSINKPFRPLPSKRLTPEEARRTLFLAVPCCLLAIYFIGAFDEASWMVVLTWMYNDLGGADEGYMFRNLLQAGGFICHARGSTLVTAGITHGLGPYASVWFVMIGAMCSHLFRPRIWRIWKVLQCEGGRLYDLSSERRLVDSQWLFQFYSGLLLVLPFGVWLSLIICLRWWWEWRSHIGF